MTAPYSLSALRELMEKATPGPWEWDLSMGSLRNNEHDSEIIWPENALADTQEWDALLGACGYASEGSSEANAALIVAAINALPSMLADLSLLHEARESGALFEAYVTLDATTRSRKQRAAAKVIKGML